MIIIKVDRSCIFKRKSLKGKKAFVALALNNVTNLLDWLIYLHIYQFNKIYIICYLFSEEKVHLWQAWEKNSASEGRKKQRKKDSNEINPHGYCRVM